MTTPAGCAAETALTRVALGLLDIPFEPAAASSGELFDTVIDALSAQLIEAVSPNLLPAPGHRSHVLSEPSLTERRRSKRGIREGIYSHRLAGQREVLAQTPVLLKLAAHEIDDVRQRLDDGVDAAALAVVGNQLGELSDVVQAYAIRHARIKKLLRGAQPDLEHLAESATRNERTLVRELIRVISPEYVFA